MLKQSKIYQGVLILILTLSSVALSYGQTKVTMIHHVDGTVEASKSTVLQTIIDATAAGDTVYLAGSSFSGSTTISHPLVIYGTGYRSDSTQVTGRTIVSSSLIIAEGAEGMVVSGVICSGSVNLQAKNVLLARNGLDGTISVSTPEGESSGLTFIENYIRVFNGGNRDGILLANNIFRTAYDIVRCKNVLFRNNLVVNMYRSSVISFQADNCVFENNVFFNWSANRITNSIFRNNSSPQTISGGANNAYVGDTNLSRITVGDDFVDVTSTTGYQGDPARYILSATSSLKGAGLDGGDIGLFDGLYPWKIGGLPTNPHISVSDIQFDATAEGYIKFNIIARGQRN